MTKSRKPRDYLQRGPTHVIDEEAQRIFRSLLPASWIINELKTDYGKDYHIEITEPDSGKVTGGIFYVQLKGADGADYCYGNTRIAHQMKLRHLSYYYDEVKTPVFLVVVDVKIRRGYWLFLQEYLNNRTWQNKKKHTVHIPTSNDLTDFESFTTKLHEAIQHMRVLSASARERVDFDASRLEAKDPRFQVFPHITKDATTYHLQPRQNVGVTLHFKGRDPTLAGRVKALVGKGEAVRFEPDEIDIQGSPLFDELNATGGTLRLSGRADATLRLICLDENNQELGQPMETPGIVEGGLTERHFKSNLSDSPCTISFGPVAPGQGTIHFQTHLGVWEGQQLLWLSHFETMRSFFTIFAEHRRCMLDCLWKGNSILKAVVAVEEIPGGSDLIDCLAVVDKARKIARHFKIDPLYRGASFCDDEAIGQIETLYDIITNGRHDCGTDWNINTTMKKSDFVKIPNWDKGLNSFVGYTEDHFCLPFLDQHIPVGQMAIEVLQPKMSLSIDELRDRLAGPDEDIQLSCTCSEGNGCILRQLTEDERDARTG